MAFNLSNIKMTRTMQVVLLVCLVVAVAAIWASLQFSGKNRLIHKVQVNISPDSGVSIITAAMVSEIIHKTLGNPMGKSVSALNLRGLETMLNKTVGVLNAQVYAGFEGELRVKVEQRIPVIRITNTAGETYLADSFGVKIYQKSGASPDVLPVNGNIVELYRDSSRLYTSICKELLKVAVFISGDPMLNAQFEQCYVDNYSDIILIPRVGKHSIVIGNAEDLKEKMRNLRLFYAKGLNNIGWDKYSVINLKYKNQVLGSPAVTNKEH